MNLILSYVSFFRKIAILTTNPLTKEIDSSTMPPVRRKRKIIVHEYVQQWIIYSAKVPNIYHFSKLHTFHSEERHRAWNDTTVQRYHTGHAHLLQLRAQLIARTTMGGGDAGDVAWASTWQQQVTNVVAEMDAFVEESELLGLELEKAYFLSSR